MSQPFNPNEVQINYTLNIAQVNLILAGLSELPRKATEGFFDPFKEVAANALRSAEQSYLEAQETDESSTHGVEVTAE